MNAAYTQECLNEIPVEVLRRAVGVIRHHLPQAVQDIIRADYARHGAHDWIHEGRLGHLAGGMGIRNLLRQHGVTDDLFPQQNLDDYYVEIVEVALNLRPWPHPDCKCNRPPAGWDCLGDRDHAGPCAAWPVHADEGVEPLPALPPPSRWERIVGWIKFNTGRREPARDLPSLT